MKVDLTQIIAGCRDGKLKYQEMFYKHFYGYAMSACLTYASNKDDALEIMHDGFIKVFNNLHRQDTSKSLKSWIRRIMVNTAIDHYRKNVRHQKLYGIESADGISDDESVFDKISAEEIIKAVQNLSPAYRMVFNLFAIEGYSHKEISQKLGIAESTSRSNLVMANRKLRALLKGRLTKEHSRYAG